MSGHSAFLNIATGGGKSLAFQVPALCLPGITLVISPLLALIQDHIHKLSTLGIEAFSLTSLTSASAQQQILQDLKSPSPKTKILYFTPERAVKNQTVILFS
jgi:superfamily II DNA helicase RecQ